MGIILYYIDTWWVIKNEYYVMANLPLIKNGIC